MRAHQPDAAITFVTSTGHMGASGTYLDAHFEMARPVYTAMFRSVAIQPGWRVLDAGCGRGNFIPLIAEAVGPTGSIAALDLAPENVAVVDERVAAWALTTPVTAHVGSVASLPFPDDAFDAVWCSNTMEYLSDADFATALAECRRVVRPGGLVAIKDAARGLGGYGPVDPTVLLRFDLAISAALVVGHGQMRTPETRRWMEAAGYEEVWQRTTFTDRWAPLSEVERAFFGSVLGIVAEIARGFELPESDQAFWAKQRDASAPEHLINQPDFHAYGAQVVAVGRVPAETD